MKFEFFIAKRYLKRGRKGSFISIISLVSILGISIGVAALIIALALINGFQSDIRSKILSSTAHIMVSDFIGDGIESYTGIMNKIKKKDRRIKSAGPVVFGTILVKSSMKNTSGAILRGIDLKLIKDEVWLKNLKEGKLPFKRNEMLIGKEFSRKMGFFSGDSCLVISPQMILSPSGIIPKIKKFKISGVFDSGVYEVDSSTIITNLAAAQKLFNMKSKISYIQIYLHDMFKAEEVAEDIRNSFPSQVSVITWKDLNASLYSALDLEKRVLFFTLTLILIVAALNIIAGLILLVMQKIKDIGILLSCGATPKIIKRIFFIQGGVVGILGTSFGVIIGLIFIFFANEFELIKVPKEIYQMSYVPFRLNIFDLFAVIFTSLLISFTATLIPSKKASKINVVDAVKDE